MRFLVLALTAVPCLLHASSVAVIQQTTTFSSSCSAGTITETPCPPGISGVNGGLSGPNYQVNADTGSSLIPPPTLIAGGQIVSVFADAGALYSCSSAAPCPPYVPLSATADAVEILTGYTTGPKRLGLIEFSLAAGSVHDDFGTSLSMTDGTNSYGIGDGAPPGTINPAGGGSYNATLPFELGTAFDVSASVTAGADASSCIGSSSNPCGFGQEGDAAVSFILLEADGTAIPFSSAPTAEPSTVTLLLAGLVTFAFHRGIGRAARRD